MEEDLEYDDQTITVPRRRCLCHSCLCFGCIRHQKKKKFPLYLIGYDPKGPLQHAASVGDLDTTERLIHSSRHHVDESDRKNRTSLHYACAHNHPDVVTLLLENNSSINIQDDEGCTPLIKAVQRDNVDCVSILLSYNADPNVIDFSGNTAFHHAVSRGNLPTVKMLLKHKVDIEAKTEYGLTPLQLATFEEKPEIVEFLEAKGAKAHVVVELKGAGTPACAKTHAKRVRFKKELCYFIEERPLSCEVRPPQQPKSILKNRLPYQTAIDNIARASSQRFTKENKSYVKKKSSKTSHRLQKGMQNIFRRSGDYVCSQGQQIPVNLEEKAPLRVKGSKPAISLHTHQDHRISVTADIEPIPSISTADSASPGDIEPIPSISAAYRWSPINESVLSPCLSDSAESDEKHGSETASDIVNSLIDLVIYSGHGRVTDPSDAEPTPGPCTLDSIERTDLNLSISLRAEDKYDRLFLHEESTLVLAPTEGAEVFFDVPHPEEDVAPIEGAEVFFDAPQPEEDLAPTEGAKVFF